MRSNVHSGPQQGPATARTAATPHWSGTRVVSQSSDLDSSMKHFHIEEVNMIERISILSTYIFTSINLSNGSKYATTLSSAPDPVCWTKVHRCHGHYLSKSISEVLCQAEAEEEEGDSLTAW